MMKQVVPRSAFDVDETGYWHRMPIAEGLIFGIAMGLASFVIPGTRHAGDALGRLGIASGVALFGGAAFGLAFPLLMRRKIRGMLDKAYRGERPYLAPAPLELVLEYRLPATLWSQSGKVGGVLYFGPSDVVFVPHAGTRVEGITQTMRLGCPATLYPQTRPATLGLWSRLLVVKPPTLVDLGEGEKRRCFLVPAPSSTLPEILSILKSLQAQAGGATATKASPGEESRQTS